MIIIGKLNLEIYKCVSPNILTDQVIITDERVEHIISRRGRDFYDKYLPHFSQIISDPDYILEANKPNSGVLLKELSANGGDKVYLILRLSVTSDFSNYKNSVITFTKIKEKEWKRMIRNKKTLYKKIQ